MKAAIPDSAASGDDDENENENGTRKSTSESASNGPHKPPSASSTVAAFAFPPDTASPDLNSSSSSGPGSQPLLQNRGPRLQPPKGQDGGSIHTDAIGSRTFVATNSAAQASPVPGPVVSSLAKMSHAEIKLTHANRSPTEFNGAPGSGRFRGPRSAWRLHSSSVAVIAAALCGMGLLFLIVNSLVTRPFDAKGCRMSYMRPSYVKFRDFDSEHTRFATKYSLYLYREQGVDYGEKLRGVPVLFVPGNAGSYKQVRPIAAEAATYFAGRSEVHDAPGVLNLDFFTVDFNEDITAFHGQTLLDQAEYLNEAVRYILSLYMDPNSSSRERHHPDPSSVVILGHSMGGVVARTMLVMPNYQANSINTILTMSAPHARPPVTFDGQIVQIYDTINNYWKTAYSHKWANDNPLWHVTLVSIAGGGLDTVVPSDYASLQSLVPETHGFTVFTTTIPFVWTSMDHQAILWCDQFRKVVTRALYDIVDARRPSQTKPRAERMRVLRKHFLTGMEDDVEMSVVARRPSVALTLANSEIVKVSPGKPWVSRRLGGYGNRPVFLLAVPPQESPDERRLAVLTDALLGPDGAAYSDPGMETRGGAVADTDNLDTVDVFVCKASHPPYPSHGGEGLHTRLDMGDDLRGAKADSTQLECKAAASDFCSLPVPSSQHQSLSGASGGVPEAIMSYLEYPLEESPDQQFIVIFDRLKSPSANFILADFPTVPRLRSNLDISIWELLRSGAQWRLPPSRSFVHETTIPAIRSSLLAYRLDVARSSSRHTSQRHGHGRPDLFDPVVRQHVGMPYPYESKYHAVVHGSPISISIHGEAPFLPHPPPQPTEGGGGLSIQLWMDPTCEDEVTLSLSLDILGSMGLLYMRYRTILAAFPLFITALVLSVQFRRYDSTGVFISFTRSLDSCMRGILPAFLICLAVLSIGTGTLFSNAWSSSTLSRFLSRGGDAATPPDQQQQQPDLFTGTTDPVFWFIMPLAGIVSIGICTAMHYLLLALTMTFCLPSRVWLSNRPLVEFGSPQPSPPDFAPSSARRRLVTTGMLLLLVSTFIPYQFAYLVTCMVQAFTTVRACSLYLRTDQRADENFYNYAHSILVLMLWILPINLPTLAVWIRNLSIHWLTPFSSHHNVWSIMPFIILVENLTSGRMIPRLPGRLGYITVAIFFGIAVYAAAYGVSHAYRLHHLVNMATLWLTLIHFTDQPWPLGGIATQPP